MIFISKLPCCCDLCWCGSCRRGAMWCAFVLVEEGECKIWKMGGYRRCGVWADGELALTCGIERRVVMSMTLRGAGRCWKSGLGGGRM